MSAAYECSISLTDDETFLFILEPRTAAGDAPVWANYVFEYSLTGCGGDFVLTESDGITIDEDDDAMTIGPADRAYRLSAGDYKHGLRMTEIASGVTTQLFDGSVSVSEGNF